MCLYDILYHPAIYVNTIYDVYSCVNISIWVTIFARGRLQSVVNESLETGNEEASSINDMPLSLEYVIQNTLWHIGRAW